MPQGQQQEQQFESPGWQQPEENGNIWSRNTALWIVIVLVIVAVIVAAVALRDKGAVRGLSEEDKQQMTEKLLKEGRPLTEEEKREMSETLESSGIPLSEEQKENMM